MIPDPTPGTGEQARLLRGIESMGLTASKTALQKLAEYTALLRKWNKAFNLVSRSDLENFDVRHLLDSLSVSPFLKPGSLLDTGTGAGLPGVPLAIMNTGLECTLLDSAGKKVRFLREVKRSLGLENMHPVHARVEEFACENAFDNICSRAFSSLADFVNSVRHLTNGNTRLIAMKGKHPKAQVEALPGWVKLEQVEPISVPDLHAERHLVIMSVSR